MNEINTTECPECGGETEFVQMASGNEKAIATEPDQAADCWIECRICLECDRGLEYVFTAESVTVIP